MQDSLWQRAVEYARDCGCELLMIDGPATDRYVRATIQDKTYIVVDAGTARGPNLGEVVYRACVTIRTTLTARPIPADLRATA